MTAVRRTPLRLLLIEDDIDDARLIVRELQRSGYEVAWERVQTSSALEAALQQQWDVIACDWAMPAFGAPAALKLLGEHGVDLPVIIVSDQATEEGIATAMRAGARDVISKHNLGRLGPAIERELRDAGVRRTHRRAEAALKASEERYRWLFETARDGIFILDAATARITDVNPFLVNVLGYRREDLVGKQLWELGPVQDISEGKRPDGAGRAPNPDLERQVQERTAQLDAISKELEAFNYSVSHDLRSPLRNIEGFCTQLLEDHVARLDSQGRHCVDRIRAATLRMQQLIADLHTLSHMTRVEMTSERVDLNALAQAIGADLRKSEPGRRVEFVVAPTVVAEGDPGLLRVVLENLLNNSWKSTSRHPSARIEFGTIESEGCVVYFVRDDGAGFDMAHAGKQFGAFQRLHGEAEFEGTGIGLATVQRIVHRHGGRVWAEAAVEHGTTIYFTLGPAAPGSEIVHQRHGAQAYARNRRAEGTTATAPLPPNRSVQRRPARREARPPNFRSV